MNISNNLTDTITATVGSINDFGLTSSQAVEANQIYLLPNVVFKHAGKLVGFKFHAGSVDATATFKVSCYICKHGKRSLVALFAKFCFTQSP